MEKLAQKTEFFLGDRLATGNVMYKSASDDQPTLGSILATGVGTTLGTGAGVGTAAVIDGKIQDAGFDLIKRVSQRNLDRLRSGSPTAHVMNDKVGRRVGRILTRLADKRRIVNNALGLATLGLGIGGGVAANKIYNADW